MVKWHATEKKRVPVKKYTVKTGNAIIEQGNGSSDSKAGKNHPGVGVSIHEIKIRV